MNDKLYTIGKAAEYCSLGKDTLRRHIRSGGLIASRTPGGHFRILKKDLESFVLEKGMYPLAHYISSSRKILIVDDDPLSQDLLTKMLSKDGYKTEIAADGFDAGFKIKDFKPGLIILDLIMPGMDGFEVCTRVKENSETSHMKILAITGYDTKENRDRVMKSGADGYLAKPLAMDTLLQYVGRLLNRKGNMLKVER